MTRDPDIPQERRGRNPLITAEGYKKFLEILDHPAAPAWNYEVGDRIIASDLPEVEQFRIRVASADPVSSGSPPDQIISWVEEMRPAVPMFQSALPEGFDIRRDWAHIPATCRNDIVHRLEDMVPLDADLSRLIVYDTSGVTGHSILVPHHPQAMVKYHPLLERILLQYGINLSFSNQVTACLNVGCQVSTVTFANVFSVWNQAGFAKVNLHERVWNREKARQFFNDTAPLFITGDPLGFAQMLNWGIETRPAAMISTAVTLLPDLKKKLEAVYRCPVIDLYSTTETGPLAFSAPDGDGMLVLPHDIYIEIVDPEGKPVPDGEPGEICVTGGRNPYLPLLRYRTGDFACIKTGRDGRSRLHDLQAREPVSFLADDGAVISMVDVARIIREWPLVQHEFVQHADCSCALTIQPLAGYPIDLERLQEKLGQLFGPAIRIEVRLDERLGEGRPGGKVLPFRSNASA